MEKWVPETPPHQQGAGGLIGKWAVDVVKYLQTFIEDLPKLLPDDGGKFKIEMVRWLGVDDVVYEPTQSGEYFIEEVEFYCHAYRVMYTFDIGGSYRDEFISFPLHVTCLLYLGKKRGEETGIPHLVWAEIESMVAVGKTKVVATTGESTISICVWNDSAKDLEYVGYRMLRGGTRERLVNFVALFPFMSRRVFVEDWIEDFFQYLRSNLGGEWLMQYLSHDILSFRFWSYEIEGWEEKKPTFFVIQDIPDHNRVVASQTVSFIYTLSGGNLPSTKFQPSLRFTFGLAHSWLSNIDLAYVKCEGILGVSPGGEQVSDTYYYQEKRFASTKEGKGKVPLPSELLPSKVVERVKRRFADDLEKFIESWIEHGARVAVGASKQKKVSNLYLYMSSVVSMLAHKIAHSVASIATSHYCDWERAEEGFDVPPPQPVSSSLATLPVGGGAFVRVPTHGFYKIAGDVLIKVAVTVFFPFAGRDVGIKISVEGNLIPKGKGSSPISLFSSSNEWTVSFPEEEDEDNFVPLRYAGDWSSYQRVLRDKLMSEQPKQTLSTLVGIWKERISWLAGSLEKMGLESFLQAAGEKMRAKLKEILEGE